MPVEAGRYVMVVHGPYVPGELETSLVISCNECKTTVFEWRSDRIFSLDKPLHAVERHETVWHVDKPQD